MINNPIVLLDKVRLNVKAGLGSHDATVMVVLTLLVVALFYAIFYRVPNPAHSKD